VKFLLDVNALMAWSHPTAHGHAQFHAWARAQGFDQLATCALAELGFLRVTMQRYSMPLADARRALDDIRSMAGGFVESPPPKLPPWASTAGKTSDAYLTQVAAAAGLKFATFDTGIPGAVLIEDPRPDD
jgi:predicted nucleic acid-binding protein